jgi:hypothetical protein
MGFSPPQRVFASLRDKENDKQYPQVTPIDADSIPHAKALSREGESARRKPASAGLRFTPKRAEAKRKREYF